MEYLLNIIIIISNNKTQITHPINPHMLLLKYLNRLNYKFNHMIWNKLEFNWLI